MTELIRHSSHHSPQPSTVSSELSRAIRTLEGERVRHGDVTVADCIVIAAEIEARGALCSAAEANRLGKQLMGFYGSRKGVDLDAEAYAAGVTAILMEYPADLAQRVCHPAKGLPRRLKFLPSLAEVAEALDNELAKRRRIHANARHLIAEAKRIRQEAEEEQKWKDALPSAEERARQVREALRVRSMSEEVHAQSEEVAQAPPPSVSADAARAGEGSGEAGLGDRSTLG